MNNFDDFMRHLSDWSLFDDSEDRSWPKFLAELAVGAVAFCLVWALAIVVMI